MLPIAGLGWSITDKPTGNCLLGPAGNDQKSAGHRPLVGLVGVFSTSLPNFSRPSLTSSVGVSRRTPSEIAFLLGPGGNDHESAGNCLLGPGRNIQIESTEFRP